MRKALLLPVLLLGLLWLAGCLEKNSSLPTEHEIPAKKAREDLKEFTDIIKKAHPALYAYISQEDFKQLTDSLYKSVDGSVTERSLFNSLSLLAARIGCAHTNVYLPDASLEAINTKPFFFPYPVILVNNKLMVNVSGYLLPEGTMITDINGVPVKKILAALDVYNSTDGPRAATRKLLAAADFGFEYYLQFGPQQKFRVQYLLPDSAATPEKTVLDAVSMDELNKRRRSDIYYYDAVDVDYDFYLMEKYGYAVMKLRTFDFDTYSRDEAFDNFCENSFTLLRSKPAIKNLIIDIRENEGGNYVNCHLLFSYLAQSPFKEYAKVSTRIKNLPESWLISKDYSDGSGEDIRNLVDEDFYRAGNGKYYMADSVNELISPREQRFNGAVFLIVNAGVNSAASYFASLIKNSGRGKIVGEETRGGAFMHNGFKNVVYQLPNSKIQFAFSIANVLHTLGDKKDMGHGVIPDFEKPADSEDFKKNNDTQLNFILDSLIKN